MEERLRPREGLPLEGTIARSGDVFGKVTTVGEDLWGFLVE